MWKDCAMENQFCVDVSIIVLEGFLLLFCTIYKSRALISKGVEFTEVPEFYFIFYKLLEIFLLN